MAPARGSDKKVKPSYSKIAATIPGSRNTRSRPTGGSSSNMDLQTVVKIDSNKTEAQVSIKVGGKEPWYEDKLPGDGNAENSFSVLYNATSSWENESESSKNKSWFDLVEEDEAEDNIKDQSLDHERPSVGELNTSAKPVNLLGIKIKEEVIDESEDGDHCEAKTEPLPVLTDFPIIVKQEKDIDIEKEKDKCLVGKMQKKKKKSSEKTRPQQNLKEIVIKQEKQDNVPLKRERNSSNIGRVESHNRKGKRIKQEVDEDQTEVQLTKDDENDKFIKQAAHEHNKRTQIKDEGKSNNKCLDHGDGSDMSLRNRKRTLDNSTESVNVKRERNTSSSSSSNNSLPQKKEYENDPGILARRQKQIDYGKNTLGYDRYRQQIPREMRTDRHPRTPPKHIKYSRRGWDGMVKIWRQQLHVWDPDSETGLLHDSVFDTSLELGSVTSDDTVSEGLPSEHTKLSTSTPSGSVDAINADDINTEDYLDLEIEAFGETIV